MKCSHYKALMRKNWINWKRTLCGSCSEFLCPLILIGLILLIRSLFDAELIPASVLYKESRIQTPMTIKGSDNSQETNMAEMRKVTEDLMHFSGKVLPTNGDNCDKRYDSATACREWQDKYLDETFMGLTFDHCY